MADIIETNAAIQLVTRNILHMMGVDSQSHVSLLPFSVLRSYLINLCDSSGLPINFSVGGCGLNFGPYLFCNVQNNFFRL